MKSHVAKSLLSSLAVAGLHLSCAGSDDSSWERPRIMPSRTSWDARASYDVPPAPAPASPVQRAAEQSSYQLPQRGAYTYTPTGGDAFPPLPNEPAPPATAPPPGAAAPAVRAATTFRFISRCGTTEDVRPSSPRKKTM